MQEVVGVKAHLSQKTECKKPKAKALKPLFSEKKSVAKGKVYSDDKQNRTFRTSECQGRRGGAIRID